MDMLFRLKCTAEEYKRYLKEQKVDKLEDELAKLEGQIYGLEASLEILEIESPRLVFSNSDERVAMAKDMHLKLSRKRLVQKRLEEL